MLEQINKYQKQNNKMKIELDERRNEAERFKALQNHSSHQQVLLNQLRSRLEEHEYVIFIIVFLASIHCPRFVFS